MKNIKLKHIGEKDFIYAKKAEVCPECAKISEQLTIMVLWMETHLKKGEIILRWNYKNEKD